MNNTNNLSLAEHLANKLDQSSRFGSLAIASDQTLAEAASVLRQQHAALAHVAAAFDRLFYTPLCMCFAGCPDCDPENEPSIDELMQQLQHLTDPVVCDGDVPPTQRQLAREVMAVCEHHLQHNDLTTINDIVNAWDTNSRHTHETLALLRTLYRVRRYVDRYSQLLDSAMSVALQRGEPASVLFVGLKPDHT